MSLISATIKAVPAALASRCAMPNAVDVSAADQQSAINER